MFKMCLGFLCTTPTKQLNPSPVFIERRRKCYFAHSAVVYYSHMDEKTKNLTVLDKLKKKFIVRHRDDPEKTPNNDLFHLFPNDFPSELGIDIKGLEKILKKLAAETHGKVQSEALCNLSTAPDVLVGRDCIPIEEIRMNKAYFRVRVDRTLISSAEMTDTKPIVRDDGGGRVYIRFVGKKEMKVSEKKFREGALMAMLGNPWGVPRTKASVLEEIKRLTGEEPDDDQLANAMRTINRKLGSKGLPWLDLKKGAKNTLYLEVR